MNCSLQFLYEKIQLVLWFEPVDEIPDFHLYVCLEVFTGKDQWCGFETWCLWMGCTLGGPWKELSWRQPSVWVSGDIIPFILAFVFLITSLAMLFMTATGVRFCMGKWWERTEILDSWCVWLDLQYQEVFNPIAVPDAGDERYLFISEKSPETSQERQSLFSNPKKKLQWKNWGGDLSLLWKIVLYIYKSQEVGREETAGFLSSP